MQILKFKVKVVHPETEDNTKKWLNVPPGHRQEALPKRQLTLWETYVQAVMQCPGDRTSAAETGVRHGLSRSSIDPVSL